MKTLLFLFSLVFCLTGLAQNSNKKSQDSYGYCRKIDSFDRSKKDLTPYRYEGFSKTEVITKPYDQIKEIAVPLYSETNYRLVFNQEGMDPEIPATKVQIFDKAFADKTRKLLYESSEKHFVFDIGMEQKLNKVYLAYSIPPVDVKYIDKKDKKGKSIPGEKVEVQEKGCLMLIMGYDNEVLVTK